MQSFTESTIRIASERPVSHIVILTHFPVEIGQPIRRGHEVIDAHLVRAALDTIVLGTALPTLVLSGHLHTEYFVKDARMPLWHYTCASSCKYYLHTNALNACALVETNQDGFLIQRYDFDGSPGRGWFEPDPRGPTLPTTI